MGDARVVECLLLAGADAEAMDSYGASPLHALVGFGAKACQVRGFLFEAIEVGSRAFSAKRIWPRRSQVTMWRVAVNYSQTG
jgi:hypothetical protein